MLRPADLRPRATLGRVLDALGDAVLHLVAGDAENPQEIEDVVIHDPLDESVIPRHALILGVGLSKPGEIAALLQELSTGEAVGLIVRAPLAADAEVVAAAFESDVAVLALRSGAPWARLTSMVRAVVAAHDVGTGPDGSLAGIPSGDLFAVANAVAALMDAPVTIEDRESRVLAFSGRQDEADISRTETILGRQVPERYSRILIERGVFRELVRSERPLYVEPVPLGDGSLSVQRIAAAVRAGEEYLGAIWVATPQALSAERESALLDATKLAALHLLRIRAGSDVQRRLHTDLLSTAVAGGSRAHAALARLGLADRPVAILGVALGRAAGEASVGSEVVRDGEQGRLADAFAMHLASVHPNATAALVGDVAYGLVPIVGSGEGDERAQRLAADFLERISGRYSVLVGIGPVSTDVASLAHARVTVDRVLRVLTNSGGSQRVARIDDVQTESLMLELRDLSSVRGDAPTGVLVRLIDHDREHGTAFVPTLRAWLDTFGDVTAAAAGLFVHPNTFRHRLRRLATIGGIDLEDPEQRFAAMLQLRLLVPGSTGAGLDL